MMLLLSCLYAHKEYFISVYHGTFIEFLLISSVLLIENHSSTVMPDCSCFESKYMVIYTGVGMRETLYEASLDDFS